MTSSPVDMARAAMWYGSYGIPVFPLHTPVGDGKCSCTNPNCHHVGKHPRTKHGLKDATSDISTIANWWRKWPDANIGMPTGAVSFTLALDIDPRNGGDESVELLRSKYGQFPETAQQVTGGGGGHLIFRFGGGSVPNSLAPGIDLKADGGYIVVAPSLHKSGRRYQWDGIAGKMALLHLAAVPEWFLKEIHQIRGSQRKICVPLPAKIRKGTQHNTLYPHACRLRNTGMEVNEIEAALVEVNKRCEEPGTAAYIRSLAEAACKFPPGRLLLTEDPPPQRSNLGRYHALREPQHPLSEVLASPIVLVVGSETEVETLRSYGFQAITNPGVWLPEHTETLRGKEVILLPSEDPTWRQRVITIARALLGKAAKIIVIELEGGKNVNDWFGRGHSEAELIAEIEGVTR
jgi:Bifunctional DNA primase/polymerase, N-terminal